MKTTLELPDSLAKSIEQLAFKRHQDFCTTVVQLLEHQVENRSKHGPGIRLPVPLHVEGGPLTIEDIEAAIAAGRE
jgi:hypothetical protein